ncbi:DUF1360 domain-containing protein [Streptomyces sp. CB03238]|uniref:DUF1360 domain-containing protein n=1 Tax=Streptomyces sp. CB03238 TaxID=1907777 RepID=UPI000A1063D7|nr:DUF1360 domain-containing protein [Streptomyces sp. CB03238]ORT56746.1 hypothetical protein BKD26_26600 [Streptomyces sp. CB03238]
MVELLRHTRRAYAGARNRPLGGYLAAMAGYGAYVTGWAAVIRRSGAALPDRAEPWDVALTSVATFRLSRLLTKGVVTSPLRAPFTTYERHQGPAELSETPRGGRRKTAGELVTCPFCMSVWVGTTFTACRVLWPRATRTAVAAVATVAGADALQLAYTLLMDKATKD